MTHHHKLISSERVPDGSESYRKRNPHLFSTDDQKAAPAPIVAQGKRIRQATKPLNKLESELYAVLVREFPGCRVIPHGFTLRLGAGLRYTLDFIVATPGGFIAVECKGEFAYEDSIVKLKAAAAIWPEISFRLYWKNDQKQWQRQAVLP